RRRGLFKRDAGLKAREQIRPTMTSVVVVRYGARDRAPAERDRNVDLHALIDRRAVEACRRDADDREWLAVHDERLADDGRIDTERVLPVLVAQHDGGRLAVDRVIAWTEQTPERRHEPEHRKVAPRDEHRVTRVGLLAVADVGFDVTMCRDARERSVEPLEVAEHRIAEDGTAVACFVA